MNLGEIRADVRSLIDEPQPGFWSNVELNRWVNQAHQELGMLYKIETTKAYNVTRGVIFNKLPDDLLSFRGAWDENKNSIPISPIVAGADITDNSGQMTIYRYGHTFALVPAPDITTTITIFYERLPKLLASDTDVPEIPAPYHRYMVVYAVMMAFQKDESFQESAVYEAEYQVGKQLITSQKSSIPQETNQVLSMANAGLLNAAEAAELLNIPLKEKIKQRVLENKSLTYLSAGVISKEDLIENTVFPNRDEIAQRLETTAADMIPLKGLWSGSDDIDD